MLLCRTWEMHTFLSALVESPARHTMVGHMSYETAEGGWETPRGGAIIMVHFVHYKRSVSYAQPVMPMSRQPVALVSNREVTDKYLIYMLPFRSLVQAFPRRGGRERHSHDLD